MYMISYDAYLKNKRYADAIRLAIKLDNQQLMIDTINSTDDELMQKQLAFILSTSKIVLEEFEDEDELMEVMGNVPMNENFLKLAEELCVVEPKHPDEIYKTNLADNSSARRARTAPGRTTGVDSARQNLASTFVNAFVNCGFGNDKLISPENSEWIYKNKSHGMMSAAASLGMIVLWDVESGFCSVDKYTLSTEKFIQAGALLATGILSSGVTSDMDAALALLSEHVESEDKHKKIACVFGLGLAYAGSAKEEVLEILTPLLVSDSQMEIVALTCLSMGLVNVGTANDISVGNILEAFLDCSKTYLNDSLARLMSLGMGLLFLGKGEAAEATLKAIEAIEHPIKKYLAITIETCAEVGSGSVLAIQKFIQICGEHIKEEDLEASDEKKDDKKEDLEEKKMDALVQQVAVLGIAMVAMGDDLGVDMALRALDHILQYGEVNIRRAIPLALALISISHPRLHVMDTLSKLTHDQDEQVSQNAILSLGFLGAGTNNSRIANILRSLSVYYAKEPNHLFLVRIAQGLLHLGKGLMTLNPFHSDNLLFSRVSMCGILTIMHSAFDMKNSILGNRHYLLFSLVTSIRPRMLITLNEDLEPVPVKVQVGQALETVAQAGHPKRITGFQTHTTPVLLSVGERGEFATDEYLPLTNVLEGFVIVRKNPDATTTETTTTTTTTTTTK